MKNRHYIFGLAVAAVMFSCKKPTPVPPPAPDAADLIEFTNTQTETEMQTFTVDAGALIEIEGTKGTKLTLPAGSLENAAGDAISGSVEVELIEVTEKSELVFLDVYSKAKEADGDRTSVTISTAFFVRITQLGNELVLTAPMQVFTPIFTDDPFNRKFIDSGTEEITWALAADDIPTTAEIEGVEHKGYEINQFGWSALAAFYTDPRTKTSVKALLPEGFNTENTHVYVYFNGENVLLDKMDNWDGTHFGITDQVIPVGLEANFIAIAIVQDDLHYIIESETVTSGHIADMDSGVREVSLESLIDLINNLP